MKGTLIKAAEQGYITQLAMHDAQMLCPEELGGACYFEPVTNDLSDWRSDWMPTLEHFPVSRCVSSATYIRSTRRRRYRWLTSISDT